MPSFMERFWLDPVEPCACCLGSTRGTTDCYAAYKGCTGVGSTADMKHQCGQCGGAQSLATCEARGSWSSRGRHLPQLFAGAALLMASALAFRGLACRLGASLKRRPCTAAPPPPLQAYKQNVSSNAFNRSPPLRSISPGYNATSPGLQSSYTAASFKAPAAASLAEGADGNGRRLTADAAGYGASKGDACVAGKPFEKTYAGGWGGLCATRHLASLCPPRPLGSAGVAQQQPATCLCCSVQVPGGLAAPDLCQCPAPGGR
jgi:hypothetical protein